MPEPDAIPEPPAGLTGNPQNPPAFMRSTLIPGAAACFFGVLGLAGMYFGIAAFSSIFPGYQTMAFSTALLLILFGSILAAGAIHPFGYRTNLGIRAAMIALIIIETIELPLNILGMHFVFEPLLVGIGNVIAGGPTSSISPFTLLLVILTSTGFLLLLARPGKPEDTRTRDSAGVLGIIVALTGFTVVLSYLYGAPLTYGTGLVPVAAPTALAFIAVGTGLITASGSGAAPLRYFSGDSIRAHLLRTFLPLTIVVILAGTGLEIARRTIGIAFNAILTAASVVAFCIIMALVVSRVSSHVSTTLEAAERKRRRAEDELRIKNTELEASYEELTATEEELRKAHDGLEEQVKQRTAELAQRNEELITAQEELHRNLEELTRAENGLRESEERYRTRFNALIEGFCVIEMIFDPAGKPADYRFLEINPAFEEQTGLHDAQGKLMRDLAPGHEVHWFEIYGKIALTGEPAHFENEARALGRWYDVRAFRVGGEESRKVAICFNDITKRKTAEELLVRKNDDLSALNEKLTATQEDLRKNLENLGQREQELKKAVAEKEVLLSEIHHRVKNNLTAFISLLSLDGAIEDTTAGKTLRQDLQNRARSMSLIHETLYRTKLYDEVDMGMYLTTLLDHVGNSFKTTRSVKTVVDADRVMLDIARATPAGLIINELVTNSYKYAFAEPESGRNVQADPPTVTIALLKSDGEYQLTVKDNGPGLPPGFDITKTQTLGLKLVNFLAKHQLRAKVEVKSGNGAEFIFRFKA